VEIFTWAGMCPKTAYDATVTGLARQKKKREEEEEQTPSAAVVS
jgi:hypothetical protein